MSYTVRSCFVGITTVLLGVTATLSAFSAPDAPDVPRGVKQPKPVQVFLQVKPKPKKTTVIFKHAKPAIATGLKGVVIDEPNVSEGTISVVTEKNEFATIATGMGTRIARGYQVASLSNIHPGYTIRCDGNWDRDGFQYQATHVALGDSVRDTDVIARINAACENIGRARKGGGFGKSLVATLPASVSRGVSIGGRPTPAPSAAPVPVPTDLVAPQNPAPAAQASLPAASPLDPAQVTPPAPGVPPAPQPKQPN